MVGVGACTVKNDCVSKPKVLIVQNLVFNSYSVLQYFFKRNFD